jgi:serine/threonine protein kinase
MSRLDDFVANVTKSGLISPSEVARARARLPQDAGPNAPARLARLLIEQGALTSYQARKILGGATRGFFLGGYKILRPLGEGGMGKVYLAARLTDSARVAIKVLPPKKALEEEQALRRFRREMELSQRLQHPNVARTLEVGCVDDVHFMVMEYIPGDSLYNIVKQGGPLRVPDAARYFLKVLSGLEAAHNADLVHRDIKPSNLMVTPSGDAKILDLGLARAMTEESPLTLQDVVIGTLDYASPEQLRNAVSADRRSDLYSLGCTLYFTVSGRPPFEGGDVVNKIYKQRMEDPEPLERIARGVPATFAAIVRKLMAKQPDDRYQTCRELIIDMSRWTDPAQVRAVLGAEAESARAFRPPPPELNDEDLHLIIDEEGSSGAGLLLRNLGAAEPAAAPMYKPPPPPRPAVLVNTRASSLDWDDVAQPVPPRRGRDDNTWLVRFSIAAFVVGVLAIILIALLL